MCSEPIPPHALTEVNFSADRDPSAHKEIKLVKSREASLNAQISEMNAVIMIHQEMYGHLENRMQLAHRSNKILTKEVNQLRSEYLVGIQAFKKSHENPHKLLSLADTAETNLALKLHERNGDLGRRVKRLEKHYCDLKSSSEHPAVLGGSVCAVAVFLTSQSSTASTAHSPPASTPPAPLVSGGKKGKGKAKRQRTASDDEDADLGGGDSGKDAPEEGRECSATSSSATTSQPLPKKQKTSPPATPPASAKKTQSSPKSSLTKPSAPAPAHDKTGSTHKKVDVAVSDAESMSSPRLTPKRKAASAKSPPSNSKKSRSKKPDAKATPGYSSELSKLRLESHCLKDSLDDVLGDPTSKKSPVKKYRSDGSQEVNQIVSEDFSTLQEDLVKLAQRASDLLTPYGAPEFTIVSAQKSWVKHEQSFLPSPVPSDAEVKCTTVGIEKFCKFMAADHPWRKVLPKWPEHACLFNTTDFQLDSHISQQADYPERLCGVWRRLRRYGYKKSAVMSFAIYKRKHWVPPEVVKCFFSRMAARLGTIKDPKERRQFKLALEHLKEEKQHPYTTVYIPCNAHVPLFLPSCATVEVLGPRIVPDLSLEPEDIDSSWDRAFRGADEDEEMEDGEVGEDDADSVATMDLNQDLTGDTPVDPQDAAAEAALILLFAESSPPPKAGVVAEI
ncbi:hypothetical protein PHMEG_00024514 [Phytophthora megakarya]|uniref:Uncharacterized protein n=1 Tax=Phytophthora megakarya TaxID=4795 RepID=A0A225VDJ0_9STRA|nr:hypothetical protein PHMEG_00024514 [Phytophthora megakarya]